MHTVGKFEAKNRLAAFLDDAALRRRLAGLLRDLPIDIDGETASHVWTTTARLADTHRLTAYDAACLELALRGGVPLASGDEALIAAARAAHVPLLATARGDAPAPRAASARVRHFREPGDRV